jgi:hypothetical protein
LTLRLLPSWRTSAYTKLGLTHGVALRSGPMMPSKRALLGALHRVRVLQTMHGGMTRRRWQIAELLVLAAIAGGEGRR